MRVQVFDIVGDDVAGDRAVAVAANQVRDLMGLLLIMVAEPGHDVADRLVAALLRGAMFGKRPCDDLEDGAGRRPAERLGRFCVLDVVEANERHVAVSAKIVRDCRPEFLDTALASPFDYGHDDHPFVLFEN